jgi:hypothetical protein
VPSSTTDTQSTADETLAMASFGLMFPRYIPDGNVFICPSALEASPISESDVISDTTNPGDGTACTNFTDGHSDYGFDPRHTATHSPTVAVSADQANTSGVLDNSGNHAEDGQNVLYIGGNVDWKTTTNVGNQNDEIYQSGHSKSGETNMTLASFIHGNNRTNE